MKKLFSVLALLAALSIMFISCKKDDTDKGQGGNNPDQDGGHVHAFLDWSFVTEPTCTAGGLCESYCECGDYQTKTLPAKGHNFVGLICDSCGEINAEVTSDEYFVFTELDDGSYSIAARDVKNMPQAVVIPSAHNGKPVTKIADYAFLGMPTEDNPGVAYCTSMEYVVIPDSVTSIGDYAFMGCFMLKSVGIPDSVNSIGMYGFSGLFFLDSITLPNQLTAIEEGTFGMCTSLKSISIPNSVTSIGEYAFEMCPLITSITIPESVKDIGDCAFYGSKVVEIISHSSIDFNKELLDRITNSYPEVHSGESKLVIQGDYQFYPIDGEMTLINYVGDDDNLILPNDCNGEEYKLQCISFTACGSDEMTAIIEQQVGDKLDRTPVFPYIRSVMLPDFVTEIESSWFENCFTLESVKIRETSKLQRIAEDAFERCPSFTYNEDEYAYYIGNDENPYVCLLKCKDRQISEFEFKPETTIIGAEAFAFCSHLTNVTLPDSLAIIGDLAFGGCEAFTDFVMPDSVTHVGSEAFAGCFNIERIIISNNIYFIGNNAFPNLGNLQYNERDNCIYLGSETNPYLVLISAYEYESTHFEMKDDTRLIYYGAFLNNRNLESVVIGKSVIGIGESAFSVIVSEGRLASVKLPDSLLYIGEMAFFRSKHLTSITIPDSVTSIGPMAFLGCTSLTDIYYTGTEDEWNMIVIEQSNSEIEEATIHFNYNPEE